MIASRRSDSRALAADRHRPDRPAMTPEDQELLAEVRIPDPHRPITTGGGQPPAVGRKHQVIDNPGVSPEGPSLPTGAEVPDPDRPVVAPRREPPPVRAE